VCVAHGLHLKSFNIGALTCAHSNLTLCHCWLERDNVRIMVFVAFAFVYLIVPGFPAIPLTCLMFCGYFVAVSLYL
jgi:hypothetical protein